MCELAEEKLVIQIFVFYSKDIYSSSFHSLGSAVFTVLEIRTWPKVNSSEKDWRSTKCSHWIVS